MANRNPHRITLLSIFCLSRQKIKVGIPWLWLLESANNHIKNSHST